MSGVIQRQPAPAPQPRRPERSFGIDAVKGVAVGLVIARHTVDPSLQQDLWRTLWIDQSVPIFLLVFALNSARSFTRSGAQSLGELYTAAYLKSRLRRLVAPALVAYALMVVVGAALGTARFNWLVLVGSAPLEGGAPGDYFIALIIALAVLLPGIWWCYLRRPRATLLGLVLIAAVQEFVVGAFAPISAFGQQVAVSNPIRMLAIVAAGLWLAQVGGFEAAWKRRKVVLIALAVPSAAFLVVFQLAQRRDDFTGGFGVFFPSFNVDTGVWSAGWVMLFTTLIVLAFDWKGKPSSLRPSTWARPLGVIGMASFHVFLAQEAVLGLAHPRTLAEKLVAVAVSLVVGWAAWRVDGALPTVRELRERRRPAASA